MADNVLDVSKLVESRKKKVFKVTLLDGQEIRLRHDAPFFEVDDKLEGKESYIELFKFMTIDEDVDKWDVVLNDEDYGQSVILEILKYIQAAVFEQKIKKDTGDVKPF